MLRLSMHACNDDITTGLEKVQSAAGIRSPCRGIDLQRFVWRHPCRGRRYGRRRRGGHRTAGRSLCPSHAAPWQIPPHSLPGVDTQNGHTYYKAPQYKEERKRSAYTHAVWVCNAIKAASYMYECTDFEGCYRLYIIMCYFTVYSGHLMLLCQKFCLNFTGQWGELNWMLFICAERRHTHTHNTHTHTLTFSLSHTHTHILSISLSLTHTHTHTHILSISHVHTHTHTHKSYCVFWWWRHTPHPRHWKISGIRYEANLPLP